MRIPKYISPSSLTRWESDREAFYLSYLADTRTPRDPQTDYMAIGSAFDAFVKAALFRDLFGITNDPEFELDTIFTAQVEPHLRDWGWKAGKYALNCYKLCGAYDDLLDDLTASKFEPEFEFTVQKTVAGVPLMGKPDCRYIDKNGAHVILDWKVNGFCARSASSPYKYYQLVRDGWHESTCKHSRSHGTAHKGYKAMTYKDVVIGSHTLDQTCADWADQLAIYSWMLGEPLTGEDVIVRIDQIVCKPQSRAFPLLRVANHICRLSPEWQEALLERILSCWKAIKSGHIFQDVSLSESQERCELLDMQASVCAPVNSIEAWVLENAGKTTQFRTR